MHDLYKNNYICLPNFISDSEADEIYTALEEDKEKGKFKTGDSQVPDTIAFCGNICLARLLVRESPRISDILGELVMPTYVYGRMYKNKDSLFRHRDRESCEISLTLNLQKDTDWPIFIETPYQEEVSIELNPGDAMLYLGCVADHWREAYTGEKYTQIFMHYVRAYGRNAGQYFDRNKTPLYPA